jgi:micrococcal nuclease
MTPVLYVFAFCYAIDGDTLRCGDERVRLARIDSVERGEAGFEQAKDGMRLLIEGKEVRCLVSRREKYGRLLGECSTSETPSLSDEMLKRGLAERYQGRGIAEKTRGRPAAPTPMR